MRRDRFSVVVYALFVVTLFVIGIVGRQIFAPPLPPGPSRTALLRLRCTAATDSACTVPSGAEAVTDRQERCTVALPIQLYAPRSSLVSCDKSATTACLQGSITVWSDGVPTAIEVINVTTRCTAPLLPDRTSRVVTLVVLSVGCLLLAMALFAHIAATRTLALVARAVVVVPGSGTRRRFLAPAIVHRWVTHLVLCGVTVLGVFSIAVPLADTVAASTPFGAGALVGSLLRNVAFAPDVPTPTSVPVVVSPHASGVHDFLCLALPYAQQAQAAITQGAQAQPYPWYVSVILAQWGVEQGWIVPGYTGYNWGNVSALAGEPTIGGTDQPGSPLAFAYARTPNDGVRYYVDFVQNGLYAGVAAAYPQGPEAQAKALGQSPWDAGHYAPAGTYPGYLLVTVLQQHDLTRFDQPAARC